MSIVPNTNQKLESAEMSLKFACDEVRRLQKENAELRELITKLKKSFEYYGSEIKNIKVLEYENKKWIEKFRRQRKDISALVSEKRIASKKIDQLQKENAELKESLKDALEAVQSLNRALQIKGGPRGEEKEG